MYQLETKNRLYTEAKTMYYQAPKESQSILMTSRLYF